MWCCRSKWPRDIRRGSAAARLRRLGVRVPPGAWMFTCSECWVLSGTGYCDGLITRPEESYRLWCVVVCDLETSWMRRPWPTRGCRAKNKQRKHLCAQNLVCEWSTNLETRATWENRPTLAVARKHILCSGTIFGLLYTVLYPAQSRWGRYLAYCSRRDGARTSVNP